VSNKPEQTGKSDEELVALLKGGSEAAFAEIVGRHSSKVYQIAYGLLGNREDAEEVVQDTFFKVFKNIGQFRGEASFSTWIYRIVTNLSRNKYNWNKRRGAGFTDHPQQEAEGDMELALDMAMPDATKSPDVLFTRQEFEQNIIESMRKLPDGLREVMMLRHVDDLPYDRISDVLQCKIGTVKSRLSRGRELLRKMVDL